MFYFKAGSREGLANHYFSKGQKIPYFSEAFVKNCLFSCIVNDFSKFQLKCFGQSWEMFWHPDFQILPNVLIYHHNSQKYLWKKTSIVWFNASKCVNYLEHLISSQLDFVGNIPKSSHTPSFQLNQTVKLQINSNIVKLLVFCNNIWYIIWTKYTTSLCRKTRNKTIEGFLFFSFILHTWFKTYCMLQIYITILFSD